MLARHACVRKLDPENQILILSAIPCDDRIAWKEYYCVLQTWSMHLNLTMNATNDCNDCWMCSSCLGGPCKLGLMMPKWHNQLIYMFFVWPRCFSSFARLVPCLLDPSVMANKRSSTSQSRSPLAITPKCAGMMLVLGAPLLMNLYSTLLISVVFDVELFDECFWFKLIMLNRTFEGYPKSQASHLWLRLASYSFGQSRLQEGRVLRKQQTHHA